jgi:hypothetical protein
MNLYLIYLFIIFQWRFYDPYNDIHRSINSETIITDIDSFIKSFYEALNIEDTYFDPSINYDHYIKIIRNNLGIEGMINYDTYMLLNICNFI